VQAQYFCPQARAFGNAVRVLCWHESYEASYPYQSRPDSHTGTDGTTTPFRQTTSLAATRGTGTKDARETALDVVTPAGYPRLHLITKMPSWLQSFPRCHNGGARAWASTVRLGVPMFWAVLNSRLNVMSWVMADICTHCRVQCRGLEERSVKA
jgi:hypothetical protein